MEGVKKAMMRSKVKILIVFIILLVVGLVTVLFCSNRQGLQEAASKIRILICWTLRG